MESTEAILDAAEAVLVEAGPSGFSIEAVARRARAGKPTIYRWWPSKTALLLDAYQRQKRNVHYPDTGDLEEDIFLLLSDLFRYWRETPAGSIFRSVIAEAQSDAKASQALATYAAERRQRTASLARQAQARGELDDGADPLTVADLVTSFAWTQLLIDRLDDEPAIRAAARCIASGALARQTMARQTTE
ncbi:TetR/AcrR family transcriptional regulator [Mesorhizobium xinjiangense]|uniref:TetR/AcrR family transcriptional regulator n=1 Tax=Mesorhizobium xinjiangense TaxID=2678685 RepID=UPI001F277EA3|nr:TetR/AcrR family transcriptional regulator [Mesorhizobium xinjiangense]